MRYSSKKFLLLCSNYSKQIYTTQGEYNTPNPGISC